MQKNYSLFLLMLCCILCVSVRAQKPIPIGTLKDVVELYKAKAANARLKGLSARSQVIHPLSDRQLLTLEVKSIKQEGNEETFYGEVANTKSGKFYLKIKGKEVIGSITVVDQKKFYRYSAAPNGSVYLTEEDIDKVLCIEYKHEAERTISLSSESDPNFGAVPVLESLPGAGAVLYLDFDGQVVSNSQWNHTFTGGNPIVAAPTTMSQREIVETWKSISEDFRPFSLNVTTSEAAFNNAPVNRRMRVIFTPTREWYSAYVGGVAYMGSFSWGGTIYGEAPCWVWNTGIFIAGESGSHEAGHTLHLRHDGTTTGSEYFPGQIGWAPIMGAGWPVQQCQWSKGEYPFANNTEDDLQIITTRNGFSYRSDDHGNDLVTATPLIMEPNGEIEGEKNKGVITTRSDVDVFSFTTNGGFFSVTASPDPDYPNLDVLLTLRGSSGNLIKSVDSSGVLASIKMDLPAGTYYLTVDGTTGSLGANSDYGSLGAYSIATYTYCAPYYDDDCSVPSLIDNFSFNTLVNNNSGCGSLTKNKYSIYPAVGSLTTTVNRGSTYDMSIRSGSQPQSFAVWIDYNQDKDFDDPGEYVYATAGWSTNVYRANITIPTTATLGSTRLRVRSFSATAFASSESCLGVSTGEAEDYTITIVGADQPRVNLTGPVTGTSYIAAATVNLTATATDVDGTISKVEFYQGATKLGEDVTPPYSFTWNSVSAGNYVLTAKATDNSGLSSVSQEVTITVTNTTPPAVGGFPIAKNSVWRYHDKGIDLGTAWRGLDYNDATWQTGAGLFGYGEPVTTTLNYGANSINKYPTYYFRYTFDIPHASAYEALLFKIRRDDGAVVYLNGVEVFRTNMPGGTMGYTSYAATAIGGADETTYFNYRVPATQLRNGRNVIAVSVHQGDPSSSDFNFDMEVTEESSLPVYQPPTVSLTAPTSGVSFTAPATVNLTALVDERDGTVTKVEFYNGNTKLGEDLAAPYEYTWNGVSAGSYLLKAKVFDNLGSIDSSTVVTITVTNPPPPNQPPIVSIVDLEGSKYEAPATVHFLAAASDADGSIAKVEFYLDGEKVGEATTLPYAMLLNGLTVGSYQLTAKAIDNSGDTTVSQPASFTVYSGQVNQPPTVSLTSPTAGTTFKAFATINLIATAEDIDGSVAKVEFYDGATKIGEDLTSPYELTWKNTPLGSHILTAKAIDNNDLTATSQAVSITVNQNPTVSLSSPLDGASFTAPVSINMSATAADVDGTVSKVEFYVYDAKQGEDFSAPYSFNNIVFAAGTYLLQAVAWDNMGDSAISSKVSITVTAPPVASSLPISKNSVWKYNDKGVDLGISWRATDYGDASWSSGAGVFGYGEPITTTISYGNSATSKHPSYYFRKSFEVADVSQYTHLVFNIRRDDGSVVYLNGVELFRTNMPGGTIGYNSFASSALGGSDETTYFTYRVPSTQLKNGTNVIAVSVHQSDRSSSDLSFDMEVIGEKAANQAPTVSITAPINGARYAAPATINFTATASDLDGSIVKVEFYNNTSKIGEDVTAPYEFTWSGVAPGTYTITAKAIDNQGVSAVSVAIAVVSLNTAGNQLPSVSVISPAAGTTFTNLDPIKIVASAEDTDGTIAKVEFYLGGTKLGEDFTAPYEFVWTAVAGGNFRFAAKAFDNLGGENVSELIPVTITLPPPPTTGNAIIPKNSIWKYNDKGIDLGNAWKLGEYDDASWSSGTGALGYDDPVTTTISFGSNASAKHPSYYFRKSFDIADANAYSGLVFNIRRDDGAVVYLNGVEVFRTNMPGGAISYWTAASSSLGGTDETTYFTYKVPTTQLRSGTNVVAVSVHQASRSSSDLDFDMEVSGETSGNQAPTIHVYPDTHSPTVTYLAPATIKLIADTYDSDGSIAKVEFYSGAIKLGEDLTAPFEYIWTGVAAGVYSASAKATDNLGASTISSQFTGINVITPPPPIVGGFPIAKSSVWKYHEYDRIGALDPRWAETDYEDGLWPSGAGVLGYGEPVSTMVSYGNNIWYKYISYHFRHTFEVNNASQYTTLVFKIRKDDGAVVYLNGVEQFRTNMPGGVVTNGTFALIALGGADETTYLTFRVPATHLRDGKNVVAVSVHQSDYGSSDMNFDMEVYGEGSTGELAAARLSNTTFTNKEEIATENSSNSTLSVRALPNPSTTHFTLVLQSNSLEPVDLKVIDASGRIVDVKRKLSVNGTLTIGGSYRPGMYFLEVVQGKERRTLKLVKGVE